MSNSKVYLTQQVREFEKLAVERFQVSSQEMMERAGKAAFTYLLKRWPKAETITVFCGSGNNGGDGYVLARLAHEHGLTVRVWQIGTDSKTPEAKKAKSACPKELIHPFHQEISVEKADVIVDALCGIGIHQTLHQEMTNAIHQIQSANTEILSLDVPTGIDADTGQVLGAAISAQATVTFIGLKLGLLTGAGIAHTGELIVNDLNLPTELFSCSAPVADTIHFSSSISYLKPRPRDWHKVRSGHVLIVGGETGYSGAPRMSAQAALRVGAGLVSIATRPQHASFMNIDYPEIMSHPVNEAKELTALVEKARVIVIGPGLGQSDWASSLWQIIRMQSKPLVVDADALNLLAKQPSTQSNWILTPHPGEAARLLNMPVDAIQSNRMDAIKAIQKRYGGCCVLKGAGSLVLNEGTSLSVCTDGNPGMATAGMGDILSGVIAGLIAQSIPINEAVKLGVSLHACAGDLAKERGERGMIATDLMPYLRQLVNPSHA